MKKDITQFVARCLTCQKAKVEHKYPRDYYSLCLYPNGNGRTSLWILSPARTTKQKDTIWVTVDRLTKSVHFIPISEKNPLETLSKIYMEEIVRLHGVPASIVSDKDPRFTMKF
jgi:hypothetical protein